MKENRKNERTDEWMCIHTMWSLNGCSVIYYNNIMMHSTECPSVLYEAIYSREAIKILYALCYARSKRETTNLASKSHSIWWGGKHWKMIWDSLSSRTDKVGEFLDHRYLLAFFRNYFTIIRGQTWEKRLRTTLLQRFWKTLYMTNKSLVPLPISFP